MIDNIVNNAPGNGGGLHISGAGDAVCSKTATSAATRQVARAVDSGMALASCWWATPALPTTSPQVLMPRTVAGGIYNNGGTLRIIGGTQINNNSATGASGSGGGLFNATGGTAEITGASFQGNMASRAGGAIEGCF